MNGKKIEKIGLFGGTFAPPHKGHVYALKTMLEHIELERVIVMPANIPPHKVKSSIDTPEQRFNMCSAAFGQIEKVEISDYEIKKSDVSYTVYTLRHLKNDANEIYLLCGSDMFMTVDQWYMADEIFSLANIVCVPRYSAPDFILAAKKAELEEKGARVILIGADPFEISSTDIREAVSSENSELIRKYLPRGVAEIVRKEKLYSE